MRLVIQRVERASVSVDAKIISEITAGLLILVGIENGDTEDDADWLAQKVANMRIFADENGVMNLSVVDVHGRVLAVSQFTLTASTKKGNRPSYIRALHGDEAKVLYDYFCVRLGCTFGLQVQKGVFGADMKVELVNDGPVTIIIDSRLKE
ncbi:MAG: D-aminoacyl-tRNA deacylase [Muribaculum sp.]|nr:D-aminoacyl-tRNA deacylase [Muribaculaceae bacterium]MCM1080621.1 D-aminoacyl-tRNA deacylase [Muribaculum sp.]